MEASHRDPQSSDSTMLGRGRVRKGDSQRSVRTLEKRSRNLWVPEAWAQEYGEQ